MQDVRTVRSKRDACGLSWTAALFVVGLTLMYTVGPWR